MEELGTMARKSLEYCEENLMSHSHWSLDNKIAEKNRGNGALAHEVSQKNKEYQNLLGPFMIF